MRSGLILAIVVTAAVAAAASGSGRTGGTAERCGPETATPEDVSRISRALRATEDVWGNELLAAETGPTYDGARRYLKPLLLARGAKGAPLTASGMHYVPLSGPVGAGGAGSMALHVADGSQIVAQRASGRRLTVSVGADGRERYGSCLGRLTVSRLVGGLPVLETRYTDAHGARYRQESFATRIAQTRFLVSFVELRADTRSSGGRATQIRFTSSEPGLTRAGEALVRDGTTFVAFSPGGRVHGSNVTYDVPAGSLRTFYVAVLNAPTRAGRLTLDRSAYVTARQSLVRGWERRLAEGVQIDVPERRVRDAARALLIQNLGLTWRYSIGNPYQQFSYPEGIDVAQVMSTHGFQDVARAILVTSFRTPLTRYRNWKMGQKLVGSALYFRLFGDRPYVEQATPYLRGYVAELGRQIRANRRGILNRERFSSDIKDSVYGLHSQAVVWQGLHSMASVWDATGHRALAAEARVLATRLGTGLRTAVRESQQRLPDGSLFVPARLLDDEKAYRSVIESRPGGYWNLVAPYAFASGIFQPGSREANGILRYMLLHGSRMLGLVRAGAYSLYGLEPRYPTSGVNPVYGLNVARFLADNDRPDHLVLSLYGQLAAGMAPGTFVSGEALSVAPLRSQSVRSMYLPPNGASNASFLETLRLMLIHERRDRAGRPQGLELLYATPRAWLAPGKRIAVERAPTSFGPVSFEVESKEGQVRVSLTVPARSPLAQLSLRLRLPDGRRIASVTLDGRTYTRFDAVTATIVLPASPGQLELLVRTT